MTVLVSKITQRNFIICTCWFKQAKLNILNKKFPIRTLTVEMPGYYLDSYKYLSLRTYRGISQKSSSFNRYKIHEWSIKVRAVMLLNFDWAVNCNLIVIKVLMPFLPMGVHSESSITTEFCNAELFYCVEINLPNFSELCQMFSC